MQLYITMESAGVLFLFSFFAMGVFGDNDVESISMINGDSVTLHTGVTKIQENEVIEWRFNGTRIAKISSQSSGISVSGDEPFSNRLKLNNQTGDLTIRNIRTTDSGLYTVKIRTTAETILKTFSVTVVSVDQIHSVLVGEFVTLQTGLTDIQKYDVIRWKFGPQHSPIAEFSIKVRSVSTDDDPDKKFTKRLQLNTLTGSLTITNTKSEDSGLYVVDIIRNSSYTIQKTFNVTISGKIKSLSVKEGETVKINTDTKIQYGDSMLWMFGDVVIVAVSISDKKQVFIYEVLDGRFSQRLKVDDQTGSLTITDITTEHAGPYKLQITSSRHTLNKKFLVNVAVVSVDQIHSVLVGASVTLETGLTDIQKYEVIRWKFGPQHSPIAGFNKKDGSVFTFDGPDKKFTDRLQLNTLTGSLTITNTKSEDSGLYVVDIIRNSSYTIQKTFNVTISATGVSPGAVAGIVVALLLAFVAAAVMGFFFYRRKISELKKTIVVVEQGDSVTLEPDAEIQRGDDIQWMFGDKDLLIAEIKGNDRKTNRYYDPDEIFKGRQELDNKTGSLTIRNFRIEHAGDYKLKIRGKFRWASYKTFSVQVSDEYVTVIDGEYVILYTGLPEIQKYSQILWKFGYNDIPIAKIRGGTGESPTYNDGPDGKFKDKLKLNEKTGDLIITNSIIEHNRLYKLQISTDNGTTSKRFWVSVIEKTVSLYEGHPVTLYTGLPEIQENNQILWYCGDHDIPIAKITGGTGESPTYNDGPDGKFKDKLKLNEKTGDLTITNTTDEHGGYYKLQISTDNGITSKRFWVYVKVMSVTVIDGNSATLKTGLPEIQKYNQILWVFNFNSTIAEISGRTGETHTYDDGPGKIFKDKLKLDDKTGDLTITNTTDEHDGVYELRIRTDNGTISKRVRVYVEAASVTVIEGDSVTLKTGLTEIQKNNQILWYCGDHDILIAVIRGGTGESPTYNDGPDGKFKNKLKLNEKTGDLTITNTTAEHDGYYKLQISTDNGTTSKRLRVIVKAKPVAVIEGYPVTLKTDLTEIQKNNQILWMFRDSPIAKITGGTEENPTYDDGPGGRFKNRLTLDKKTGDLTITNTTAKHDGVYKLQIRTDNGITSKRFRVYVIDESVTVIQGDPVTLYTGLPEIQKNNQILWMFRGFGSPIAKITGGTGESPTYDDGLNGRFKNKLKLNKKTGDLTITNTIIEHDGYYKLQIRTDNGVTSKRFWVYVSDKPVPVIEGKSSTLNTGLPEIQISTDKGATSKRFNAFAEGKEVNDTYVNMPLLEDPDGANEQEAMSSL